MSPLSGGDSSPANVPPPGDKSPGIQSCDPSQHSKTWRLRQALFCLLPLAFCLCAHAQYALDRFTLDGGGGTSSGGVYSVTGTSGELLVQYASVWKYQAFTNDPGTAWRETNYEDGAWLSGLGIFGAPMDEPLPVAAVQDGASLNTPLPQQPGSEDFYPAYYFRTRFTFSGPATNVLLTFSNVVDDGAVFYLNGEELGPRLGMNPGPVSMTNFANRVVEVRTTGVEVFHVVPTNLLVGTNLLAVELHNSHPVNHDVIFGLSLSCEPLPVLNIRLGTNAVILWWETSHRFVLEQATDLDQSWTEVQPGGIPCTVATTNTPSCFFRLRLVQNQP